MKESKREWMYPLTVLVLQKQVTNWCCVGKQKTEEKKGKRDMKGWTWVKQNDCFDTQFQSQITTAQQTAPNTSKQNTRTQRNAYLWSGTTNQNNGTPHNHGRVCKAQGRRVKKEKEKRNREQPMPDSSRASQQTAPVTLHAPCPTSLAAPLILS